MKNNIVVPQKATKTTNATLCHIPQNSQNDNISQNDVDKINEAELSPTNVSGWSLEVFEPAGHHMWPNSGQYWKISQHFHLWVSKNFQKNRFFRFFQNCIYMNPDIKFARGTCLGCLEDRFPAIYHHFGHYRPIYIKLIFRNFWIFCDFSIYGYVVKLLFFWVRVIFGVPQQHFSKSSNLGLSEKCMFFDHIFSQ